MSRTRRRHAAPDDPRLPRKFRQDSGVNLMHEEPWFGFNVAAKMPTRGDSDPAGNPFLGLPSNRLKYRNLTNDELADNAVDGRTAQAQFLDINHFPITGGDRRIPAGVRFALGDALGSLDVNDLGGGGAGHTIDPALIPGIGSLSGTLDVANLGGGGAGHTVDKDLLPNLSGLNGDLGPGRVPGLGKLKGKVKAHSQIDWGGKPSIPPNAVKDGYDYRRLDHKPSLKKFLTRADFRADGTLKR